MRKRYPYPAFLPDQIAKADILTTASNVLPSANGYLAVKSLAAISAPLAAQFRGGGAFISTDGNAFLLAGTSNGLQRYSAGNWTTLLAAMSVTDRWRFTQFGNYVIAVNSVDTKQVDLGSGTASDLTNAPTFNFIAVVGDFVVGTQAGGNRLLVQWSAFNDHTQWTAGVNQSGFQPMLTGGEVKGIAGGEYGIILQRFRLVRMERTGDASAPFNFAEITPNFGCASAASIAQAGRTIFFLSDRGFMALEDGQSLRPIGNEKFDQSFRAAVSPDQYENLWAAVDPKRSLVMWGNPGAAGRIWVYNWVLDRASTIDMPFAGLFAGYSSSTDLDALAATYPDLDAMPFMLDDPRFQGGDPRLFMVTAANEVGALTGPNLAARLSFGWTEPVAPNVAIVRSAWPDTDARGGVSVLIDARQRLSDASDVQVGGGMQASGRVPLRCKGRYLQITVEHAAGSVWSYAQGLDLDLERGGVRGGTVG